MAINKRNSSLWVKIVVVFVVLAFVASLVPAFFLGGSGPQPTNASTETGATLERIANDHVPAVASSTAALQADPEDYNALVNLGNVYYDWGLQIMQALGSGTGHDLPMWTAAVSSYERALAIEPGDPNVEVDMAIAYFYSGQTPRAIEVAERVMAESPEFAPAYYNGAIFYRASGQTADAVAALERYLELEPEGQSASAAYNMLAEMQAESAETTTQP